MQGKKLFVKQVDMNSFFTLLEDEVIDEFLRYDSCFRVCDKYLLAMVFVYFKRAGFTYYDFTRMNFFAALFLAHDMEEDEEENKYEIFPWILGRNWKENYPVFLFLRDKLWRKMNHRAVVSRKCCDEVISIQPFHKIWKRDRLYHHGGAICINVEEQEYNIIPRGPYLSPLKCPECIDYKNIIGNNCDVFASFNYHRLVINNYYYTDNI